VAARAGKEAGRAGSAAAASKDWAQHRSHARSEQEDNNEGYEDVSGGGGSDCGGGDKGSESLFCAICQVRRARAFLISHECGAGPSPKPRCLSVLSQLQSQTAAEGEQHLAGERHRDASAAAAESANGGNGPMRPVPSGSPRTSSGDGDTSGNGAASEAKSASQTVVFSPPPRAEEPLPRGLGAAQPDHDAPRCLFAFPDSPGALATREQDSGLRGGDCPAGRQGCGEGGDGSRGASLARLASLTEQTSALDAGRRRMSVGPPCTPREKEEKECKGGNILKAQIHT
jgi:hypothetical protein